MYLLRDHRQVAGMPELAYAGLSENWLLKECGQRHWRGIAGLSGQALPRFADTVGRTAYAAFTAITLSDAALEEIGEHTSFGIRTGMAPAGRSQYFSRHVLSAGRQVRARIRMLSAFVYRGEAGNNQSVARAVVGQAAEEGGPLADDIADLLQSSARARRGEPDCAGLTPVAPGMEREFRFLPCPNSDFNGANFLYFAAFRDIVERAEWTWFRRADLPRLARRQMCFYGNVNVGDEIHVRLMAERHLDGGMAHWCRLLRNSDGARIADVVTHKRAATGANP